MKLFVVADDEVRAQRRFDELVKKGMDVTRQDVLSDIRQRDARDSERAAAPMTAAGDAHVLDTTQMNISQAVEEAIKIVAEIRARR